MSELPYVVLNPVFNQWKTPPVWYEYERVNENGTIYFKRKETYELKVYCCTSSDYIKKYISLS
jgi:hypothetical protein